jgi:hypothetical protein
LLNSLLDKHLVFGFEISPLLAQVQKANFEQTERKELVELFEYFGSLIKLWRFEFVSQGLLLVFVEALAVVH